jgi:opacity protein-like surface antigen
MDIVKFLAAAGFVALGVTAARAADLTPLPPAPLPPPAVEFAGTWYIRGDVGVASYSTSDWTQPVTLNPGDQVNTSGFISKSIQEPAFIDVGIGYQFLPWFRADVTAEYRTAIGLRGVFRESVFNANASCSTDAFGVPVTPCYFYGQNQYPGTLQSSLVMANGYFDLGTWYGVTPYVGGGIGAVRHQMSGFTDSGYAWVGNALNAQGFPNGPLSPVANSLIAGKTQTNFAWALMAGLSYSVTPNLKLDIGYRYMNLGNVNSGVINCLCNQVFPGFRVKELTSNEVRIGMRWIFGDFIPVAAPPVPEYPPQPPIVRKY